MRIRDVAEGFEDGFKNLADAVARDGHTDLFPYLLLRALKYEIVWECLKAGAFAVCECAGFFVMVDVRTASSGACHGIRWPMRVKAAVELADLRTFDMQLEFWMRLQAFCVEDVFSFPDELQAFLDELPYPHAFVVRCLRWNGRNLHGFFAGFVHGWFWGCRCRRRKFQWMPIMGMLVVSDADDDDSMAFLRDTILLEFVEVWVYPIACLLHVMQDGVEGPSSIRTLKPSNVLAEEPCWLVCAEHADTVGVEWSVLALEAHPLANEGEIIAWETKGEGIERMLLEERIVLDVDGMNILAEYAFLVLRADVVSVGFASRWIDVVCPRVLDAKFWMVRYRCLKRSQGDAAWSAEKFPEAKWFLHENSPYSL